MDLWFDDNHTLDPERYKRLIGKLIHLTVTKLDITSVVGVLSRFMHQPKKAYWSAALRILTYIKSCSGKAWCTRNLKMHAFLDTLIQVMLVTEETRSLLLDIVPLLKKILRLGVRNKMLYLAHMQKQSMESWLILHVR